jgi:Na+-translocating ferredoxin:NAD+ oxidoreductase subunit B
MPFEIIAENCTGCSACEKRCPTGAISGLSKKVYYIEAAMCIDCGACGVICPDDAIMNNHGEITHVLKRAERPVAVVHPDNCNGCGVCVDVCPFDCISPSPENTAVYLGKVQVNEKTCVGCLLCEEVCGWDGIYIMPSGQKEAFLTSLGYDTSEESAL